jgi:4-hydroxy-4-methyl-2-oxoglutarate aldolase
MALSDALIDRAAALSSATLHEASGRRGALPSQIKPIDRAMRFAGRALPVRSPAGDNLQLHHALAQAQPGDVLVVDTGTGAPFGYWGEIMATAAIARKVTALVITGGVRDSLQLIGLGHPTFSSTICILGTGKDAARDGAVGEPVRIGEIVVRKGDLVMGDADGVVVYPAEDAERIIAASEKRDADELLILEKIRGGALTLDVYKF